MGVFAVLRTVDAPNFCVKAQRMCLWGANLLD